MTTLRATLKKRTSMFALLFVAVAAVALIVWWLPASGPRAAPAVPFALLDGTTRALAEFRGRPVLVNFWATTCPPCVEELPELIQLYRELRPRGFEMIAVAAPYDPPLHVQAFAAGRGLPYPIALDVEGRVAHAFGGVPFIPAAFVIAADGNIVYRQTGKLDIARVRRIIEPSLATPNP